MFIRHQNRNMLDAALQTLALIYHHTVYNLRKTDRSPVASLISVFMKPVMMLLMFLLIFYVVGVRHSPIRGDFVVYILSGIFMYLAHVAAVGAVSGCGAVNSAMQNHGPINSAVLITSAALTVLYQQVLAALVVLWGYHAMLQPISLYDWQGCLSMLVLCWFWGCCVGLIFLAITPWWPKVAGVATTVYQRFNMIASGKMFVANALPAFLLPYFAWNPLFHIIDQTRGFAFINYNPRNSSLEYPIWCCIAFLMIGLMLEFVTRRSVSISWSAGK